MSSQQKTTSDAARKIGEVIPLPLIFTRSSLFAASRNEIIPAFNKKPLYASGAWTVLYTGFMLRQADLDVWSTCLRLIRKNGLSAGERLLISRRQFINELNGNKKPNGKELDDLVDALERLRSALISVRGPVSVIRANLLAEFNEESIDGASTTKERLSIALDPLFQPLLEDHIAENDLDISLALRQALAKWLYRYATTCSGEFRVGLKTLYELSGNSEDLFYDEKKQVCARKAMPLLDFRKALRKAIEEILEKSQGEFEKLSYERNAGADGEGQVVIKLAQRPRVLMKKQEDLPSKTTSGKEKPWGKVAL